VKLTKEQKASKQQLNFLCKEFGFEKLRSIVQLAGGSLGQYLSFDSVSTIPVTKLQLALAEHKLSCNNNENN